MFRSMVALFLLALVGQIAVAEDNFEPIPAVPQPVSPVFVAPQAGPLFSAPTDKLPTPPGVYDAPAKVVPHAEAPHPVRQVAAQTPVSPKVAVLRQKQQELAKLQQEVQQLRLETRTSQQILVHVQMLEFSLTKMRKLGVDLPQASSGYFTGSDLSRMLTTVSPSGPQPYTPPKTKANSNDASNVVDWMIENNIGKIMSEPNIVVLDGRPANFHVGGEIPMPAKDSSKVVEYQPFGTQIDLLATSLGDDRVRLELRTRVSEVDEANSVQVNGMKLPALSVRQISTGFESAFGQPTVLTGMIQQRTETIRISSGVGEVANRVRGKASTRDVTNEICLMLVVTPERLDEPETAQRLNPNVAPK